MSETPEPLRVEQEIPVFLPGQRRNWDQVKARAIIASDGAVVIKCYDQEDCIKIVDCVREGILYQLSFDYRMSDQMIKRINRQNQPSVEHLCEVMHDAYEKAAAGAGWETQEASRKPWADVPEANKITMRAAVKALMEELEK